MNDSPDLENVFFGAHRAIPVPAFPNADPQDVVRVLRARTLPRHRARRRSAVLQGAGLTATALQTIKPQHAYDSDAVLR